MVELKDKDYVVIVQCHIVKERCSGYSCEKAFLDRSGGFEAYPKDKAYRMLNMTCGGCCGRGVQRKLTNLIRRLKKGEGMGKDRIVVQLASCLTKDNYHSTGCPSLDYLKGVIAKTGLDIREDTVINDLSEKRRAEGVYAGA